MSKSLRLKIIHDRVSQESRRIVDRLSENLACRRGCHDCCIDGLSVLEIEAERIRLEHASLLANESPAPPGRCAFLGSDNECRIYASRPYVCQTQGLPLRWLEEDEDGEILEHRDVCEKSVGVSLENLGEEDCWLLGPVEEELVNLSAGPLGEPVRVPLRSLFRSARG